MIRLVLLLICLLVLSSRDTFSLPPNDPIIDGYVTRGSSLEDFDVNGFHILLPSGEELYRLVRPEEVYLGEPLTVYGTLHRKARTISPTEILVRKEPDKFGGFAIIDHTVSSSTGIAGSPDFLFRADGYVISISSSTPTAFHKPLNSFSDVGTNVWIAYHGTQRNNGVIVADKASFQANEIRNNEDKLREKSEYDPASVNPAEKQSAFSMAFKGVDFKKVPPYEDAAMQARVDKIAASLVPEYQRALSDNDSTKIQFRVQLIGKEYVHDASSLPSGIILLPKQVVERMQNDSQLATVLADNIAEILEKQAFNLQSAEKKLLVAEIAGFAGGAFVPGLAAGTLLGTGMSTQSIILRSQHQSGRVSLCLLHDAGYDVHEAPRAWWLLASKKPRDPATLADIKMPERAAYLYYVLGTTWRGQ
jgi:hypothetical protein